MSHVVMSHVVMLHVVLPPRSSARSMYPKASLLDSAQTGHAAPPASHEGTSATPPHVDCGCICRRARLPCGYVAGEHAGRCVTPPGHGTGLQCIYEWSSNLFTAGLRLVTADLLIGSGGVLLGVAHHFRHDLHDARRHRVLDVLVVLGAERHLHKRLGVACVSPPRVGCRDRARPCMRGRTRLPRRDGTRAGGWAPRVGTASAQRQCRWDGTPKVVESRCAQPDRQGRGRRPYRQRPRSS